MNAASVATWMPLLVTAEPPLLLAVHVTVAVVGVMLLTPTAVGASGAVASVVNDWPADQDDQPTPWERATVATYTVNRAAVRHAGVERRTVG